jgi:hypothetical protein
MESSAGMDRPCGTRGRGARAIMPFVAILALLAGCGDDSTQPRGMALAVDSVSPRVSEPGETLEVRILGTGFQSGALAFIERGGSAAAAVVADQTRFVSDRELLATVTVGMEAELALYDVVVANPDGAHASAGGIFTVEEVSDIIVAAAEPSEAGLAETVEVRILGSGFQPGDVVAWELDDEVDTHVIVEQTVFVSDEELIATIAVQADARVGRRNVSVSRPRKRGIGTVAFHILPGTGSELEAMFRFTYDGYRSDSFQVDHTFVLDPRTMDPGSWGLTYYHYEQFEQVLGAHYLRDDGLLDMMWCGVPGGRVREPGTRALGCWFTPQYNWETGEFADPEDYTSWVQGDRPGDGTGTITFTSVTPERLVGTFSITMHVVDWPDWVGSPSIEIRDGDFDLPVVSSYYQKESDPEDGDDGGEVGGDWVSMNGYEMLRLDSRPGGAWGINSAGLMVGWLKLSSGYNTAVRWTLGSNGKITGPERLGSLPAPYADSPSQVATAVNAAGVIVGYARQTAQETRFHNFVYDGEMKLLPQAEGVPGVYINDQGLVLGSSGASDGRALVWSAPYEDPPMRLPPLDGDDRSSAWLIDNHGLVVGRSSNSETGSSRWVSWHIDGEEVTGPAEFEMPDGFSASGMNSAGDFVGMHRPGSSPEPMLLRSGALTELGFPDGSDWGHARSINDPVAGRPFQIIGSTQRSGGGPDSARVTVWTLAEDGTVSEPVDLGYGGAVDINAHGWIVGMTGAGSSRAGVWRPATQAEVGLASAADRPCRTPPRRPRACRW